MKFQCVLALYFFLSFFLNKILCQENYRNIVNYTADNGLPQSSVKDIEFDKNGYCWLSTEVGMVRFDGSNFKLVNPSTSRSTRCGFF